MAGVYRDLKGRFISADKYLNDVLPGLISWGTREDVEYFESEKNKIISKYALSFDEEENEYFKPYKVKGSLRENAEYLNARTFEEVIEIAQQQETTFPYWEASGFINEAEADKAKIYFNEKLIFQGSRQNSIEHAQDKVREINNAIKGEKTGKGNQNTYAIFFAVENDGVIEIHFLESESIDVSDFNY
jgi:hypothetical protein